MNKITTKVAQMSFNEKSRILQMRVHENAKIGIAEMVENVMSANALANGKKYLKLVEGNKNVSVTKEARDLSAAMKEWDNSIAVALVVKSMTNKIIANFYINFNKPAVPTRIFTTKEKAIEWLNGFLYLTETSIPVSSAMFHRKAI
jgi:hypothetical protein